jgi:CheY-like chemotaxis protein
MNTLTSAERGDSSVTDSETPQKLKLLIVDDDESVRGLLRMRLSDTYNIVDTGDPEQALAFALEHKPDAILLDLLMPGFSGFELCQTFHGLSYTSRIPIYVITGEDGAKYKGHVESMGAKGYFHKPVDFAALKATLAEELKSKRPERRAHKRVQMRVSLKLRGTDSNGNPFDEGATTENLSAGGFLCNCLATLSKGTPVDVFLSSGGQERYGGRAQCVRRESSGSLWQRYGFQFLEATDGWVLQGK